MPPFLQRRAASLQLDSLGAELDDLEAIEVEALRAVDAIVQQIAPHVGSNDAKQCGMAMADALADSFWDRCHEIETRMDELATIVKDEL